MRRTFPELPRWTFTVTEVSAGVFEVLGTDERGRRIETGGAYAEALLAECRDLAGHLAAGLAPYEPEHLRTTQPDGDVIDAIEIRVARSWSGARVKIDPREGGVVAEVLAAR